MFNYRSMSDVELLNAYREILVAKRRQILWRAMENHNAAEKKIPNPGADHEKLAVLSSGSSCCTELVGLDIVELGAGASIPTTTPVRPEFGIFFSAMLWFSMARQRGTCRRLAIRMSLSSSTSDIDR